MYKGVGSILKWAVWPLCNPLICNLDEPPSASPSNSPTEQFYCGCPAFTIDIWNIDACNKDGECHTCGERINFLKRDEGQTDEQACTAVSDDFSGPCGPVCNPLVCNELVLDETDPTKLIWSDEFDVDGEPNGVMILVIIAKKKNVVGVSMSSSIIPILLTMFSLEMGCSVSVQRGGPMGNTHLHVWYHVAKKPSDMVVFVLMLDWQGVPLWPALWMLPESTAVIILGMVPKSAQKNVVGVTMS